MLLLCSSYSYSEHVDLSPQYGTTSNAASRGYDWVMQNVLPQQAGLLVNQVAYRYTTVKEQTDQMVVHVQNENARGPGYIFRDSTDWTGLPGNTLTKVVPIVNGIDISYWGRGSIEVEGTGSVQSPEVFYTYTYDPCFDPQTNIECPGYIDPFVVELTEVEVVDPLDDDNVQNELDRKTNLRQQKEDEKEKARKKALAEDKIDQLLEQILGVADSSEFSLEQILLHQQLMNLGGLPISYQRALVGGDYSEGVVLKDARLPNNSRGLRVGMAQELLHQEMIMLQYAK